MAHNGFADLNTIDHITHIKNLPTILECGLLPHGNAYQQVDISNFEVNARRSKLEPIYKKRIHDYVPFYFNPRNAMLYRNKSRDVVILGFNKNIINMPYSLFTDGNAACNNTAFYNDFTKLSCLNWRRVFSERWTKSPSLFSFEETTQYDSALRNDMMAEVLIPGVVSVKHLAIIYCKSEHIKATILANFTLGHVKVEVNPYLFFEEKPCELDFSFDGISLEDLL